MTFGSLFAGIGGMDLGLERAGMTCRWQVEIDEYARRVLAKHWPDVRRHDDIRTFPPLADDQGGRWREGRAGGPDHDGQAWEKFSPWSVDLICGGFPCQDISFAGKGAGLAGERSGLWYEFARVVCVLQPRYVLVENVSALLVRGLDAVLGTLAADGYDAEWACIPAASVGAPHIRDRVFIVATLQRPYPDGEPRRPEPEQQQQRTALAPGVCDEPGVLAHATGRRGSASRPRENQARPANAPGCGGPIPHPDLQGLAFRPCFAGDARAQLSAAQRANRGDGGQWHRDPADDGEPQSRVGRVAHGVPARMERLRGLGNAVVPQVAEWIGRRILAHALESLNSQES